MRSDEEVAEGGLENGIAEKFELLIIPRGTKGSPGRGVSEGTSEEIGILKRVAKGGELHEERFL